MHSDLLAKPKFTDQEIIKDDLLYPRLQSMSYTPSILRISHNEKVRVIGLIDAFADVRNRS